VLVVDAGTRSALISASIMLCTLSGLMAVKVPARLTPRAPGKAFPATGVGRLVDGKKSALFTGFPTPTMYWPSPFIQALPVLVSRPRKLLMVFSARSH
jgi:hypothetical protein